jgi:hypothetical protein
MRKLLFAFIASALSLTLIPGTSQAAPGDPTIYPIDCTTSGWIDIHLAYGVNSITFTNPSGCNGTRTLNLSNGRNATWTYSQTISGTTTSGSYDPEGVNLLSGEIWMADSFTLTFTSTSSNSITMSNGMRAFVVYFNNQFDTLSPDPVAIGQQVTVTGSNLSSVTNVSFQDGSKFFSAATSNRTATQLTFTVPLTVFDFMSQLTINVTPGSYRMSSAPGKTLTLTAAPVVELISAEELARQARVAANAQREIDKRSARDAISSDFKRFIGIKLEIFKQAEIKGITAENIESVQAEIDALPKESRGDISQILKIARKYEVVGMIASERVTFVYSSSLIEIGLIPADSKHRAALMAAIKKLPASERSSYAAIKAAIDTEMAEIQARDNRSKRILSRIVAYRTF